MKKTVLYGLLVFLLAFSFIACGDGNGGGHGYPISGTFLRDGTPGVSMTFNSNGTFDFSVIGESVFTGTFSMARNVISIHIPDYICDCLEWYDDDYCYCDDPAPSDTCACEPDVFPFDVTWFRLDANTLVTGLGTHWRIYGTNSGPGSSRVLAGTFTRQGQLPMAITFNDDATFEFIVGSQIVGEGTFTVIGSVVTLTPLGYPCECPEDVDLCPCAGGAPVDTCACSELLPFDLVWFIVDANTLVNALGINWVR